MNHHWFRAAKNALDCHMAHAILASKGKVLGNTLSTKQRNTSSSNDRLDQTILFSIHPLISTCFPKSFDHSSQDVRKLRKDQA